MILTIPPFKEGVHYERLKGTDPRSNRKYRFILLKDVTLEVPMLAGRTARISFRDVRQKEWARVSGSKLIMRAGYAWNGATPCFWFLFCWVGTPTPPPVVLPTLVHDICFQFLLCANWPIPFKEANDLFLALLKIHDFRLANTYYGAVRDFGSRFTGEYPARGEHSYTLRDDEE